MEKAAVKISDRGNQKCFPIPKSIISDTSFPFEETDDLMMVIVGDSITILKK